ncbi:MAG: complex I subunit 4 family protein [Gammaproteobacteria bacterium]
MILNLLIWLPILGGGLILLPPIGDVRARFIALATTLIALGFCVPLYIAFDTQTAAMQFTTNLPWIEAYNIRYAIGVDGISMPLILLTAFTGLVVVLAAWTMVREQVSKYLSAFLMMQGMMTGMFAATDSVLFYVFWEAILIPMYLAIGIWGSEQRVYASLKFFLYTFLGSVLMLVAILYLGISAGSFAIADFYPLPIGMTAQVLLFSAFLLAFGVKVPMWPVHTWLPDVHTEAPAGGSIILAALMLKMGGYGFFRFTLPIVPDASELLSTFMIILSLIAIVYIGFIAIIQRDMKKLIAYSSIAHMGFVTLGCFLIYKLIDSSDAYMPLEGALIQMISHGFSSGALFLGVGILYERLHTRLIQSYGGVAHRMPIFAAFFMLFAMANVGLPGTSGFVGEFMVILSAFKANIWIAIIAATTLILGAAYTLWMYKRVFFGEIANAQIEEFKDINRLEILIFALLGFMVLFIGLYPNFLLELFHPTIGNLIDLSLKSKL